MVRIVGEVRPRFVNEKTVGAKSHFGQAMMGPTLSWPIDEDWFEVVGHKKDNSKINNL